MLELLEGLVMSFGRGESVRLVADLAEVGAGDRVVDVGCGPGRFLWEAAVRGAEAVGVEPSAGMRRVARWRMPASVGDALRVVDGAAERLPLEDGWATAGWSVAAYHHWTDPDAGLAELRRVLAPGGRLVIAERLARSGGRPQRHALTWQQAKELAARAERAGFTGVAADRRPLGRRQLVVVRARVS